MLLRDWEGPLTLKVNQQRFLRELPNFFASFHDALSELLQNAYRAGASQVEIELDYEARTVRVADNGRGSTNAQAFLTAGETGWDESVVVDPAGLGFFALLGLSEEVVVTCRTAGACGWQMTLTQEAFNGAEVAWHPIREEEGPTPTGCVIAAKLLPRVDLGGVKLGGYPWESFRQYFPLEVVLTRRGPAPEGERVQLLRAPGSEQPFIETPVGRLTLLERRRVAHSACSVIAVWEHRGIESKPLWLLLRNTILEQCGRDGQLMWECLRKHDLVWFIDPASGVRPKLPDRNALIQDEALKVAVRRLIQALITTFDAPALRAWCAAPGRLPDQFSHCSEEHRVEPAGQEPFASLRGLPLHPFFDRKPRWLLELAGYESTSYPRYEDHEYVTDRHEGELHVPAEQLWVRHARHAPCELACEIATREGHPCVYHAEAPELEVRVAGPELIELWDGIHFGRCERIELWQSGKQLDQILQIAIEGEATCLRFDGKPWPGEIGSELKALFLMEGSREAFMAELAPTGGFEASVLAGWLLHALSDTGQDGEYINEDEEEGEDAVDYGRLREDMRTELIAQWWPSYKERARTWERTAGIRSHLGELRLTAFLLQNSVGRQRRMYPDEPIPELAAVLAFAEQVMQFEAHLDHYQVGYQELEGSLNGATVAADHEPDANGSQRLPLEG